jgi:hypothetical protein
MIKSMKHVRGFLAIVFVLAGTFVPTVAASAHSTVVDGGKITVHARIEATHYIMVDEHDKIIQIDSNTNDTATPRVFLQKVKTGNERDMTPTVYAQYQHLIPGGVTHVGTVYRASSDPVLIALDPHYRSQLPALPHLQ